MSISTPQANTPQSNTPQWSRYRPPKVPVDRAQGWRRRLKVATAVTAAALVWQLAPVVASAALPSVPVTEPAFPTEVSYSWWTPKLSESRIDRATMLYLNRPDDLPEYQEVLLGTDGGAYRKLGTDVPLDADGYPVTAILSPDGGSLIHGTGVAPEITVTTLSDGSRRTIPVPAEHALHPLSVTEDGRTVLVSSGDPYDPDACAVPGLIDLVTGELRLFPGLCGLGVAALSPDGTRIAALERHTQSDPELDKTNLVWLDAADGRVRGRISGLGGPGYHDVQLDANAWSADGRRIAFASSTCSGGCRTSLWVVDVSGAVPTKREFPLSRTEWSENAYALGWRDTSTVLVAEGKAPLGFAWVDVTTGDRDVFSTYRPDWTSADLLRPQVARNLLPQWQVQPVPADRGPGATVAGAFTWSALAGIAALLIPVRLPAFGRRGPA